MKILATKQTLFTLLKNIVTLGPSTWVGHTKHYFFTAFFCLALSSCGGGGGGGDSASSSTKANAPMALKACESLDDVLTGRLTVKFSEGKVIIPNGKLGHLWYDDIKDYGDVCEVDSCDSGLVKNLLTNNCDIPSLGKYADSSGDEQHCSPIKGDVGGFKVFVKNENGVATATGCDFTCNDGYVKDSDNRACNYPDQGKYVTTDGNESECTDITSITGFDSWLDGAAADPNSCPFSCNDNKVADLQGRTCETSCPVTDGIGHSLNNSSCSVVTCNAGYDNSQDLTQCEQTVSRFYSLANRKDRVACPSTPDHSSDMAGTGFSSAADCYSCDDGYFKNTTTNTCDVPLKGKYFVAGGAEKDCTSIKTVKGAKAIWKAGPASAATGCDFTCNAGYVKNERECSIPASGNYADNGVETVCTDITGVGRI